MMPLLNIIKNKHSRFFIKYLILFIMLFLSISAISLLGVINKESNPFFYSKF
jgi:hypothetical protein